MKEKWDERYAQDEYVYGVEPNAFFKEFLADKKPGRILLPADGEGRNAVYAASQGWDVYAFDYSAEGKNKAENLAKLKGVSINYEIVSVEDYHTDMQFDVIGLFYLHLPENLRKPFFTSLKNLLNKQGVLVCEFFSKKQLDNNSGGPPTLKLLYDLEEILPDFEGLQVTYSNEIKDELFEGLLHKGKADLVRIIAKKR